MAKTTRPTDDQLRNRLTRLLPLAQSFSGIGYRSSTPRYASEIDLLTGQGSQRHGGRWNPIGIAVVYLSLSPETAMAETLAHHRYYGISIEAAMPRMFVAVNVKLQRILDLRDGHIRQRLQVSESTILSVDWRKDVQASLAPITQQLGRAAFEVGLEGLVVPSAAGVDGHNLLVFPAHLSLGSTMQVLNASELPD